MPPISRPSSEPGTEARTFISVGNGERYAAGQIRFLRLVRDIGDEVAVPATPEWNVHDVMSHVVGVATDLVTGRLDRWSQPSWTAEQVSARVGWTRDQLIAEWNHHAGGVVAIIDDPGSRGLDDMFGRVPLIDLIAHEHDVREAIGDTSTIGDADWAVLGPHRRSRLDASTKAHGAPPLRVVTDQGDDWVIGGEPPRGFVRASRQELWRSLEGRRTRAAVRAFEWSVDPEPYLDGWLGPVYEWPDEHA